MASIINSDNGQTSGSAGLKFTSGDDGVLEIQNSGTTAISISSSGVATFTQPPLTAMPVFMAYLDGSTQSITSGVNTKIQLNTIEYDTETWFDSTTNYRYTPQIAGYYQFNGLIYFSGTGITNAVARIYKNGNIAIDGHYLSTTSATFAYVMATGVIYLNGSSDYVELFGLATGTSLLAQNGVTRTWLQGFLVRAT